MGRLVMICHLRHSNEEDLGASDRASNGEGDRAASLAQNLEHVMVHANSDAIGCSSELPKNL
jgi:hypothetical protein